MPEKIGDVYDRWGRKVGEVRTNNGSGGMLLFLVIALLVLGTPLFLCVGISYGIGSIRDNITKGAENATATAIVENPDLHQEFSASNFGDDFISDSIGSGKVLTGTCAEVGTAGCADTSGSDYIHIQQGGKVHILVHLRSAGNFTMTIYYLVNIDSKVDIAINTHNMGSVYFPAASANLTGNFSHDYPNIKIPISLNSGDNRISFTGMSRGDFGLVEVVIDRS